MENNIKCKIYKLRKCFRVGKRMTDVLKASADYTRYIIGHGVCNHETTRGKIT